MDYIKHLADHIEQTAWDGNKAYNVIRLIELARNLPVMEIPLEHINMEHCYRSVELREMCGHFMAIENADLSYPIILNEDGGILDGRHRLMKAIILKKKTIKAVRFLETPYPDRIED
jgi:hypothetical protein